MCVHLAVFLFGKVAVLGEIRNIINDEVLEADAVVTSLPRWV